MNPDPIRRFARRVRRTFRSTITEDQITSILVQSGISAGQTVVVHTTLSSFGSLKDGAHTVINGVLAAIGSEGTMMVPTYPTRRSTLSWVEGGEVFDAAKTTSQNGLLTEVFRTLPGVIRDRHPTHPVACKGRLSAELINGHLSDDTPMGINSPYRKLESRDDAYNILFGTRYITPHSLQERTQWPGTFLNDWYCASFLSDDGCIFSKKLRVHAPYGDRVAVEKNKSGQLVSVDMRYWLLQFPSSMIDQVKHVDGFEYFHPRLVERQKDLVDAGVIKFNRIGLCETAIIKLKPFVDRMAKELRTNLDKYSDFYSQSSHRHGQF